MIGYYFALGVRHLRRNPILTTLMIATLGVGIAASMATLTVLRAMSADPIPEKSDRLFTPLVDLRPADNDTDPEPPSQLSYADAVALRDARKGIRQAVIYQANPVIEATQPNIPATFVHTLATDGDFFGMLDMPFIKGGAWSRDDDARGKNVVVLRESIAERYAGAEPIGKTVRLDGKDYVVVGVIADDWPPLPRFYRVIGGEGAFGAVDDAMIPFTTAIANEVNQQAAVNCFDAAPRANTFAGLRDSQCTWMAVWVELAKPEDAAAIRDFIVGYMHEQRALGRFPRPDNYRLYDVMGWLDANRVVTSDTRTQTYLAFGFLLVCLVNVIGLLLAKFTARAGEIGVRRALGALRRSVFHQYLTEAAVIGLAGGIVGIGLTYGSLWLIGRQSEQLERLAHLDGVMLSTTLGVSVVASVLAGLLPTWRACQVQPALQLKSQ